MKLSISNIAWSVENDNYFYSLLKELGFKGLENCTYKNYI